MSITPAWTGGDDTAAVQAALNDGRAIDAFAGTWTSI